MTKQELIRVCAVQLGVTQVSVGKVLDTAIRVIVDEVSNGGKVGIPKFGTFKRVKNRHTDYYDINSGTIKPRIEGRAYRPAFSPGTAFTEAVSKINDERKEII